MKPFRITVAGALIGAAALAPAAAASGTVSHASLFTTKNAACGIAVASTPGELLCSARGIPRPPHTSVGDPFVSLGRTGKPKLVAISQDSFGSAKPATLSAGDKWSDKGFSCTIAARTVTCRNGAGHGFTIGGTYKSF